MIDPIDAAMKAASPITKLPVDNVTSAAAKASAAKEKVLSKLPKIKDPELTKKQVEAEAQKKISETKLKALEAKDQALQAVKGAALGAVLGKLPKPPKLPKLPSPPSVAAGLALVKKLKETEKERRKTTKENMKKSVEAFTFPIKPKLSVPTLPKPPVIKDIPLLNKQNT